mgnify:CR=1 FL=1
MDFKNQFRILGYYHFPNRHMKPEENRTIEAKELAPLLGVSLQSIYNNPETDIVIKKAISTPTIFILKDKDNQLYGYFTKDKTVRLTNVKCDKRLIKTMPFKYKAWFTPGQEIGFNKEQSIMDKFSQIENDILNLKKEDLFELWGVDDCEFIGYYHKDPKSEGFLVDDLRKTNFERIPPYLSNNKPIELWLKYPQNGIILDNYYRFVWKLSHKDKNNPYEIYLDNRFLPQTIIPKWFIDKLFEDRHNDKSKNFGSAANFLDTLSKQLSARESTFVYELLQNANDYPVEGHKVDVEFYITDSYLLFLHSGDKFNVRNISGICGINEKEKVANRKTIGYKGIGFKTVFLNNHYVYIRTGDYSFRFDQGETPEKKRGGKIRRQDAPFQILPIWTEHNEISPEVNSVFDNADKKFQVKIALRPDDKKTLHFGKNSYENLFRDVFSDSNIILFIPNINSVRVFINGKEERTCFRDSEKWVVSDYEEAIPFELQEKINKTIDKGNSRIPEKYKDFDFTKVSFACKRKGAIIKPVEDTTLYCYLPTNASWGLPFLMNTDMIPKGDRNNIETEVKLIDEEETNFNEELAAIAGSKLFMWVKDLLCSRKYHLGSVFSLIPDFKKCKKEHKDYINFIDKFAEAFDKSLESDLIVPVHQGFALVNRVILDTIGLSSSGIMTDDEFRKFTQMDDSYLPLPMLRQDKNFNSFLKRYASDEQKFDKEDLTKLIANKVFQEWLKVQDNNNKFLKFLLDNDYLKDLLDEKLFLEDEGALQTAIALFYDVDEYLKDLQAFTNHIYFLSRKTREYFNGNEKWEKIIDGKFARFDCKNFVDNNLLSRQNKNETIERLKDKNTSIHFFKFLAENVEFSQAYKNLPYINDEDMPVDSFNADFIFVENEEGKLQTKAKWLEGIPFSFISADYGEDVLNYFKNTPIEGSDVSAPTFGVLDYDKSIIIKHVILNEKYAKKVNANQQKNDNAHKSFISFCYTNKVTFNTGSLKQYAIKVNERNKDEETRHELTEANVFFETPSYDAALAHPWIGADWMFSLSNDLLSAELSTDTEQLKKFYEDKFGVKDFSNQIFYDDIVSKNMDAILKATSKPVIERADNVNLLGADLSVIATAKKSNIDFVSYLNNNVDIIFKDNNFTKFNKLALLDSNEEFIGNNSVTFFYNEALSNFMSKAWLPSNIVNMCSKSYGHSTALEKMQVNQNPRIKYYDFATLYNLVIVSNLTVINKYLDDKTVNFDFHNSIIANIGSITPDDRKKISNAKVFIRGKELPVVPASGHKIVSKTVEELVELSLVDYSELDLLDQNYHANEHADYWQEALCNESFSIKSFLNWLINNKETIAIKLQDKTLNIKFWRWAKKNIKDKISCLLGLPILVKGKDVPCTFFGEIYFSDEYLDTPIESLVTTVAPNAPILTSDYISLGEEKKEWVDFWTQLGVQQNEVEVLENIIRTRLSATKVSNLAELIYKNRVHLEAKFDNNLMGLLADIQLVGTDYQYRTAKDCAFVSCAKEEPFAYISIPNRVGSSQAGTNSFIGEIIQRHNSAHYITDLNKWRQEKIEAYLALQNENKQAEVHMALIKELAVLTNTNKDNLSALPKVNDIHLLARDNTYKPSKALTEGSKYHPFFDFEACGITLDYISDCYLSCSEPVMKLFNYMKVHHNLEESDLPKLRDYTTACYFWKDYLGTNNEERRGKNIKHIESFITNHKNPFKELVCIPTLEGNVVKAESLYSLRIKDKVVLLTDSEKLLPLDIIAEGVLVDENSASKEGIYFMDKLPFKNMLSVQHCFNALCNISTDIQTTKEKELRKELVMWIICQKDDIGTNLVEYRANENALWYNGLSQKQQIAKLYALNPKDNLEQYFGNNAKIIDASYVANKDKQLDAFAALGIKVISQTDVDIVPSADKKPAYNSNSIKKDLKFYTLIISGIESSESWKNSYEEYCSKVDKMSFWTCSAIEKKYKSDEGIVKKLSGFYHEEGKDDFYYKDNLDSKLVFLDYVNGVKKYLGIKADTEIVKKVMDSKQTACDLIIAEYGRLLSDEEFVEEVRKTMPKFNHKDVESTTKPTMLEPVTESVNPTRTEPMNPPKVVEKAKKQEANEEDSENIVHIGKADTDILSQQQKIEAQLEAQKYLLSVKPLWKFPDNFAEKDEEGRPYCFSTFKITDEEGNERAIVLKSYKFDNAPFSINPEEWDCIINLKARLLIYRGDDIVEIEKEDLVKNQNSIILRFSTENLDVEDKVSQFSNLLHFFKQIHFDFDSFNVSKRAKSILKITNKNIGTQTGGSNEDI